MNIKHVIDLTHPITTTMPYHPYDAPATLKQLRTVQNDNDADYQLTSGMHVGTHIDGPAHILESPLTIANFPANHFIGPGILIDARDKKIDKTLLEQVAIKPDAIVLVLTGHSKKYGTPAYFTDHPTVSPDFAQEIMKCKINVLGIDLPSPDHAPFDVHKLLLQRNILILENLTNLERLVGVGDFTVAALPLKIEADSAPARVIVFY